MWSIHAKRLYDGNSILDDVYIVIEDKKIIDVTKEKREDIPIKLEASVVTPAFIDAHSHIGMARHAEPSSESEVNDTSDLFLPDLDPLDSVYFDDPYFRDALDFGVLYSCIIPGSGNLIGGKAVVIRNFAPDRRTAVVRYIGYKMALGFNPRSTVSWRGHRFNTRMGVYAFLFRKFHQVMKKRAKIEEKYRNKRKSLQRKLSKGQITEDEYREEIERLEYLRKLEFSPEELAILEILDRKKKIKVHVHKEDDVIFLVEFMRKFELVGMADHLADVYRTDIFEYLKENGIPIVYGPIDSYAYKTELKHKNYRNIKSLLQAKPKFALMSDHPVTLSRNLLYQLRYFVMYGLDPAKAIGVITKNAAEILGVDDILGTVEPGKYASLVVWNGDPFFLGSRPTHIVKEGVLEAIPD